MVVKPLLVESSVAVLALNPWVDGMRLVVVVGQACFSQSQKRATSAVKMESIL